MQQTVSIPTNIDDSTRWLWRLHIYGLLLIYYRRHGFTVGFHDWWRLTSCRLWRVRLYYIGSNFSTTTFICWYCQWHRFLRRCNSSSGSGSVEHTVCCRWTIWFSATWFYCRRWSVITGFLGRHWWLICWDLGGSGLSVTEDWAKSSSVKTSGFTGMMPDLENPLIMFLGVMVSVQISKTVKGIS